MTDPFADYRPGNRAAYTAPDEPVSNVLWVPASILTGNDYNPNHVAKPEMQLLTNSILASGWTQPIVTRADATIVDGWHRHSLALTEGHPIHERHNGYVPVVILAADTSDAEAVAATVSHNRARGKHHVVKMSDLVVMLIDELEWSRQQVSDRLQMQDEEIDRLYERGRMDVRGSHTHFNRGWVPQ